MATIDRLQGARTSKAIKAPVAAATTANITLSGEQTVDGIALVADDRILVKDQTDQTENGIYVVAGGAWSRARDFNKDNDISEGTLVMINAGTVNADRGYILDTASPVIGTSNLTFTASASGISGFGATLVAAANAAAARVIMETMKDIVEDLTPQLGGMLDVNGKALGDGTRELLKFIEDASAVNELTISNAAAAADPELSATGDDTDIGLALQPKGTGRLKLNAPNLILGSDANGDLYYRSGGDLTRLAKGTALQMLRMNGGATAPEWAGGAPTVYRSSTGLDLQLSTTFTWTHGLSAVPDWYFLYGECTTTDGGFSVGEKISFMDSGNTSAANLENVMVFTSTDAKLYVGGSQFAYLGTEAYGPFYVGIGDWDLYLNCGVFS